MAKIEDKISFRQIHLDFHTGGEVPDVGNAFNAEEFQKTLLDSAVDSITCFAVCHHGFCYYPSEVGPVHPSLKRNLLREQIDAAHAVGIRVPVYISVGGNEEAVKAHPEWREVPPEGLEPWGGTGNPPLYHKACLNSGYLDFLCRQTEDVIRHFPDADGLFFDIVFQEECLCPECQSGMKECGLDPNVSEDRQRFCVMVMDRYYERISDMIERLAPGMPVFHNSCHVNPQGIKCSRYYSHWELESLPTGGWGYDHFPLMASFARNTGFKFIGMTGKFHGTWGEFGGLKTPQALRYECSLMLASGGGCSIGDQCHPCGKLDESTYAVIGQAYREVREKEPFCKNATNRAEIAILAVNLSGPAAIGLSRILLEGHFLFDVLLPEMDYSAYPMVIVPDDAELSDVAKTALAEYASKGGRVLAFCNAVKGAALDFGATTGEKSGLYPIYMLPDAKYRPEYLSTPVVCYAENTKMQATTGESLGEIYYPYFNRTPEHFSGHRYTPNRMEASEDAIGVRKGNCVTLSMPLFSSYAEQGQVILQKFLVAVIAELLGDARIACTNLPSTARCYVTEEAAKSRQIVHLLYANLLKRGNGIEIIDELLPLHDISVSIHIGAKEAKGVFLEPTHRAIPFRQEHCRVEFKVDDFTCHQMVAIEF